MRLACHLIEIRGKRKQAEVAREAGIHSSRISQIERGVMIPFDHELEALERAYGAPVTAWYPPRTLLALEADPREG